MNKLEIRTRYSDTDEPDKDGRWARLVYYNGKLITWINKNTEIMDLYLVNTYFPVYESDNPLAKEKFYSFDDAIEWLENAWNEFLLSINYDYAGIIDKFTYLGKSASEAAEVMRHMIGSVNNSFPKVVVIGENHTIHIKERIEKLDLELKSIAIPDLKLVANDKFDNRPFYHKLDKNKRKRKY